MRVSHEKALENREQIIETAARLLREHGFDGIGVADIMKAAGLTHGGFYRNFASKDDLAVKASERAIADTTASDDPALRAVFITAIQGYLEQIGKLSSATPRAIGSRHPAAILSEMVGAVILSRVIADNPLAESLIAAVVADIAGPSPENKSAEE
jgi:TetR/AcrR family transcriptional regulator, transcriptional repressor for nem operon